MAFDRNIQNILFPIRVPFDRFRNLLLNPVDEAGFVECNFLYQSTIIRTEVLWDRKIKLPRCFPVVY